jgi:hypothetical protein
MDKAQTATSLVWNLLNLSRIRDMFVVVAATELLLRMMIPVNL